MEFNSFDSHLLDTHMSINIEEMGEQSLIFSIKIFSIILITILTLFFGFMPLFCSQCRKSSKLLGLANAFSGGLFMGIALFHLLPESNEHFEEYFASPEGKESDFNGLPMTFFIAFMAYSLILLLEKVAFDSHSLTEHTHGDHDEHSMQVTSELPSPIHPLKVHPEKGKQRDDHGEEKKTLTVIKEIPKEDETKNKQSPGKEDLADECFNTRHRSNSKRSVENKGDISQGNEVFGDCLALSFHSKKNYISLGADNYHDEDEISEEDSDQDEQTLKNVVSSKGKFASYLQARNLMKSHHPQVLDKSLFTAGKILERTIARPHSIDLTKKTKNVNVSSDKDSLALEQYDRKATVEGGIDLEDQHHKFNPTSNMTPYILLIALSIHGLFEGTALGVQCELKDVIFLALAIIAHKWAESFALGISFYKSNTERGSFIRMILLFALFTPLGITIGLVLAEANALIQGVFLGLSAGTFLYVSASEVIVEEFAITKYRYQKYFLYLCGGILVGILSYLEVAEEV